MVKSSHNHQLHSDELHELTKLPGASREGRFGTRVHRGSYRSGTKVPRKDPSRLAGQVRVEGTKAQDKEWLIREWPELGLSWAGRQGPVTRRSLSLWKGFKQTNN